MQSRFDYPKPGEAVLATAYGPAQRSCLSAAGARPCGTTARRSGAPDVEPLVVPGAAWIWRPASPANAECDFDQASSHNVVFAAVQSTAGSRSFGRLRRGSPTLACRVDRIWTGVRQPYELAQTPPQAGANPISLLAGTPVAACPFSSITAASCSESRSRRLALGAGRGWSRATPLSASTGPRTHGSIGPSDDPPSTCSSSAAGCAGMRARSSLTTPGRGRGRLEAPPPTLTTPLPREASMRRSATSRRRPLIRKLRHGQGLRLLGERRRHRTSRPSLRRHLPARAVGGVFSRNATASSTSSVRRGRARRARSTQPTSQARSHPGALRAAKKRMDRTRRLEVLRVPVDRGRRRCTASSAGPD